MVYDKIGFPYKVTAERICMRWAIWIFPSVSVSESIRYLPPPPPQPKQPLRSAAEDFIPWGSHSTHTSHLMLIEPAVSQYIFNSCVFKTKDIKLFRCYKWPFNVFFYLQRNLRYGIKWKFFRSINPLFHLNVLNIPRPVSTCTLDTHRYISLILNNVWLFDDRIKTIVVIPGKTEPVASTSLILAFSKDVV